METRGTGFIILGVVLVLAIVGVAVFGVITSNNITDNRNKLTTTQTQVTALQTQLSAATNQINTLSGQLATTQGDIAKQLNATNGQVSSQQQAITALQGQLTSAANDITSLKSSLTSANSQIATLQTNLTNSGSTVKTLQDQLTAANNTITSLQSTVTTLQTNLTSLTTTVSNLQNTTTTTPQTLFTSTSIAQTAAGQYTLLWNYSPVVSGTLTITASSNPVTGYILAQNNTNASLSSTQNFNAGTSLSFYLTAGNSYTIIFGDTSPVTAYFTGVFYPNSSSIGTQQTLLSSYPISNLSVGSQIVLNTTSGTSFYMANSGYITFTGTSSPLGTILIQNATTTVIVNSATNFGSGSPLTLNITGGNYYTIIYQNPSANTSAITATISATFTPQ